MSGNIARRRVTRRLNGYNANGKRQPRVLQFFIALLGLGIVMVAIGGASTYGVYRSYANDLVPPDEMIAQQPSGGAQIFDRNGTLLYEFVDDRSGLRSPVKLEDISPWLIAATISTEDFSYWDNPGVNTRGLVRAGLETIGLREADAANSTGGSSITQQLVKNVYIPQEDRYKRSYTRKLKETIYAFELTNDYSKNQILEWYLNQISYGGLYNGVEAASQGYFGKSAKDLTLPEAALLAGIPACPSCYDPVNSPDAAIERRNAVLRLMKTRNRVEVTNEDGTKSPASRFQVNDDGTTVDATDTAFYLSTLNQPTIVPQRFPVNAPHWVFDYIQPELERLFGADALHSGGLRVTTTLDLELQEKAQQALERWISEFEASASGHNGALVAMDPNTSEILVMVGSRDYFREDIEGQVNNATALNSPGSTLKPFTYAATFEKLGWGPETLILDTPISFPDGDKDYVPRNPSGNFQGQISIRNALGNSLNIPAAKAVAYVGVPGIEEMYKRFGITSLDPETTYGPAITLGGIDVSLADVTYAYTVFANNGVMRGVPTTNTYNEGNRELDPVSILQVTREIDDKVLYPENTEDNRVKVQERRVIDAQYAYMINNILSDPNSHCITYGCNTLTIGRPWGVKTGTSEPFENSKAIGETWTYGYTPDLVAGVWAGNADNSPMYNITSTSISYRALRDFMTAALVDVPSRQFERPPGLKEVEVCVPSGLKATPQCPRRVKTLLSEANLPQKDDDWWKSVKIDIRDGLLATELTPPQFVATRFGMTIPENVTGFARSQAQEWARALGGGSTPTQPSTGQAPVRLDKPKSGDRVGQIVEITGKADSENFVAYRLEFGLGTPPAGWTVLLRSTTKQPDGGLGLWNTAGLEPGTYTLRLVLEDSQRGELSTFVTVTVGGSNSGGGGGGTDNGGTRRSPSPTPRPSPIVDFGD